MVFEILANNSDYGSFVAHSSLDGPVIGVPFDEVSEGAEKNGLPFQRRTTLFQAHVKLSQHRSALRVTDRGLGEKRNIAGAPDELCRSTLQQGGVQVKDSETPTVFVRTLSGMGFAGVKDHDLASRCSMNRPAVIKALGALFDHAYRHTFVRMARERVVDVAGMQELDIADIIGTPYFGVFPFM